MKLFLNQAVVALASVVLTMVGFWLIEGRQLVTRAEVATMIATEGPYLADRKLLLDTVAQRRRYHEVLAKAIQANTSAVADLRVAIAELSTETRHLRETR